MKATIKIRRLLGALSFRSALVTLLLVLGGCATPLPDLQIDDGDQWRARGKFSFQSDETKESGNFDWRQSGDRYQARLFGPLGFGTVQIEGDLDSAKIRSSNGEIESSDPTQLAYEATGMYLPIADFPYWLRDQSKESQEIAVNGTEENDEKTVDLAGWQVRYSEYQVAEDGKRLPGRILATQNSSQILLIIQDWQ